VRERVDQHLGRLVPGRAQHREVVRIQIGRDERFHLVRVPDGVGVVAMDDDLVELVQAADVVVVSVRRHRDDRPTEQLDELGAQTTDAQARVDQQIAIAPADQKQVGSDQRQRVRLGDPEHALVDLFDAEPALGDAHLLSRPP
jgi:hypothetical protein